MKMPFRTALSALLAACLCAPPVAAQIAPPNVTGLPSVSAPAADDFVEVIGSGGRRAVPAGAFGGSGGGLSASAVSALPASSALTGAEAAPCVQGATLTQCTPAKQSAYTFGTGLAALPAASALTGAEMSNAVQGGVPVKTTVAQVAAYTLSSPILHSATYHDASISRRGFLPILKTPTNTQAGTRQLDWTSSPVTTLHPVWPNFYIDTAGGTFAEIGAGGPVVIKASLEYPLGTICATVTFGGAASGTASDGGWLAGDVTCPMPAGAAFAWRTVADWGGGAGKIIYWGTGGSALSGESFESGTTAAPVTDRTAGGSYVGAGTYGYGPLFAYAKTNVPSACSIGDSRDFGTADTTDANGNAGEISKQLGTANVGRIKFAAPGHSLAKWLTSNTNQLALANAYCSNVIVQMGINDVRGGAKTLSQMQALMQQTWALFPSKRVFQTTPYVYVTSSDGYATRANQTVPAAYAATLSPLHTWLRSIPTGLYGVVDDDAFVEDGVGTGYQKTNGTANYYSPDGLHLTANGVALIVAGQPLDVSQLRR